jgi:nucleoside-diphosphate-sugar epimerase
MRIAITGATGNVGSALVRHLAAGGHELVGIARRVPPQDGAGVAEWHPADLSTPESSDVLARAFRGADAVVHLAWGFQPSHRLDHLEALGVGGTRRVIGAVVDARVPHLVHMSSVGAYSPKVDETPVSEDYPTGGVPSSPYSRHKSAAERLLDDLEREERGSGLTVSRMRPGIVGQRAAGSSLMRYGLPVLVPGAVLRHVPVVPLDRAMVIPMVHADDVADGFVRVLEGRVPGPFNLSAGSVTAADIAHALGGRHVQVPTALLHAAADASWRLHLQQVDPGWVDLARQAPSMSTERARAELGWAATRPVVDVLHETVAGMAGAAAGDTPVLRRRTVLGELRALGRRGPVSRRPLP